MTTIQGDVTLLGRRLFCMTLEEAKSSDPEIRDLAHRWLTDENYMRELILEAIFPDIHQDWIDDYVRQCKEEFDGQHSA